MVQGFRFVEILPRSQPSGVDVAGVRVPDRPIQAATQCINHALGTCPCWWCCPNETRARAGGGGVLLSDAGEAWRMGDPLVGTWQTVP